MFRHIGVQTIILEVDILDELNRLVARSDDRRRAPWSAEPRGRTLGLAPLPAEVPVGQPRDSDPAVTEFAEQFSVDVSTITAAQRSGLREILGENAFGAVVQIYVADFVPRGGRGPDSMRWGCRRRGRTRLRGTTRATRPMHCSTGSCRPSAGSGGWMR